MKQLGRGSLIAALASVLCAMAPATAAADAAADFYKGKTLTIVVGFGAGGGYDLYARLVAQHLGRLTPGAPAVVVNNMAGAGSIVAANYIYNAAPKDGTMIGSFLNNIVLARATNEAAKYEPEKFLWLGRTDDAPLFGVVWHTVPVGSVADAVKTEIAVASTGATAMDAMVPWALNRVVGTKFKVVAGYKSNAETSLALERGEVHGIGAMSFPFLETSKPEWLRENKIKFIYVSDLARHKKRPDVPAIVEFAKTEDERKVLRLIGSSSAFGRSYAATPGIPPDRAVALRRAFETMLADPLFLADAKSRNLDINALSGAEVEKIVAEIVATPTELVRRTQDAIKPP